MPFGNYAAPSDVARAYQITLGDEQFVTPSEQPVSGVLRDELAFAQEYVSFVNSEAAICETLIFPILKEVWKSYLRDLMLWSHEPLFYDADLSGTPDYFLARRSSLGRWGAEPPYLVDVEAKRDDFVRGWAQCLAALLAAQKLNNLAELTLYGITTNGRLWEFGRLQGATLTKDTRAFSLLHLEELLAAIHFVFEQCRLQVLRLPRSA